MASSAASEGGSAGMSIFESIGGASMLGGAGQLLSNSSASSDDSADPCAAALDGTYDRPMHIAAIFIIMGLSFTGTLLPILGKHFFGSKTKPHGLTRAANAHPAKQLGKIAITLLKLFGAGVIMATALVHMLVPAGQTLTNPCLPSVFNKYQSFSAVFALVGIFVTHLVQVIAGQIIRSNQDASVRQPLVKQVDHSSRLPTLVEVADGPSSQSLVDEHDHDHDHHTHSRIHSHDHSHDHNHSHEQHGHSNANEPDDDGPVQHEGHTHTHGGVLLYSREKQLVVYLLELGIASHSVIIGITLGVESQEFKSLLIALCFHQFFEGIALSAIVMEADFKQWTMTLGMVIFYTLTTPIGIATGVAIRESYNANATSTLLATGILDSISAGILIYDGLINVIGPHFTGPSFEHASKPYRLLQAVPILGVCLGEQCIFEMYGGVVKHAGEIIHGKTTPLIHDSLGLYEGVPQNVECTRYHSLAGDPTTLPDVLKITSRTENGIVMGVRHKVFVMEGVQFHPESIASEFGKRMIANFLSWEGGSWASLRKRPELVNFEETTSGASSNTIARETVGSGISLTAISKMNSTVRPKQLSTNDQTASQSAGSLDKSQSILQTIMKKRAVDVADAKNTPGSSFLHLQRSLALGLAPSLIDFKARLSTEHNEVAVLAEIKRASPSKGNIDIFAHAATQARLYAIGGASAISVLTEPTWFKGSLTDMLQARLAVDNIPNRPAILRKDFILDRYQILEARLHGADTLLLIVACLSDEQLVDLMAYSRELGMEPLVEVASTDEMHRAVRLGAQVIGVNNRDLNTFQVDTSRTTTLASIVPKGVVLLALSGITKRADIEPYVAAGAHGVLVGEALMKATDKQAFIRSLIDRSMPYTQPPAVTDAPSGLVGFHAESIAHTQRVKICGITNEADALVAADAGADFIGLIFAPESPRAVTPPQAKHIIDSVRTATNTHRSVSLHTKVLATSFPLAPPMSYTEWYQSRTSDGILPRRTPLFVGVFTTQTAKQIQDIVDQVGLDLVQLHGGRYDTDLPALISVPVIQVLHVAPSVPTDESSSNTVDPKQALVGQIASFAHRASYILLDTAIAHTGVKGGTGVAFDWNIAADIGSMNVPLFVAGGLTPENVAQAVSTTKPWCVDVASGVEASKGIKDHDKVRNFIRNAKSL
eukprot:jgi/Hompol1/6683/HPOL_002818-RA